jgi:hypothetical protein
MWEIIAYHDKNNHNDLVRLGWTYLHGKLEEDAEYDVYLIKNSDLKADTLTKRTEKLKTGKYPCHYKNKPCTIYYWVNEYNDAHGLVVYDDDEKSVLYAEKCVNENESVI